jgi:DNA-binding response OmpR family regulator
VTAMQTETESTRTTVLLVDDSLELLRGLRLALSKEGYLVEVLSQPSLAQEVIERVHPDLLVLDVMMPGVDGWQVLRMVRDHPEFKALPVLMLTAKGSSEAKVAGFTLGADDYLTKPFDIVELKCRIRALLRRSDSRLSPQPSAYNFTAVVGSSEHLLIPAQDVYFVNGVRNYTYLHTHSDRFLSRAGLGETAENAPPEFMRVHRSYIVNMCRVSGGRWLPSSSYQLTLSDERGTQIPVSRKLVVEVQSRAGLK